MEHSSVFIKLNEDGTANLVTNPCDPGTGSWGTLAQIAAEELGLCAEDIRVVSGDTDLTMFDIGCKASRVVYITGNAVLGAAREAKAELLERAAGKLGRSADELDVRNRRVYVKANPRENIPVSTVAREAIYNFEGKCLNISGKCSFEPTMDSPPAQAAFAEVEVDTETGRVKILRLVIVNDSGTVINPTNLEGQLEGGVAQGIGFALTEDHVVDADTGLLTTDNSETYKLMTTLDMPEVEIVHIEKPDQMGPFGAKSVGESSPITIAQP
jgi:xanthine dehydrogenase molybdenum-binding subunit